MSSGESQPLIKNFIGKKRLKLKLYDNFSCRTQRLKLQSRKEKNVFRNIFSPFLNIPRKLFSNFWGDLNENGFYKRSEDYVPIVQVFCVQSKGHLFLSTKKLESQFVDKDLLPGICYLGQGISLTCTLCIRSLCIP